MKLWRYIVGPDPYENHSARNTEGNGHWSASAETLDKALEIIFGTMSFPAEATGRWRSLFVPEVSITGLRSSEVIQVWTNKPEAVRQTQVIYDRTEYKPHAGDGQDLGLLVEIPVREIYRWLHPEKKMLGYTGKQNNQQQLSEIGLTVTQFLEKRVDLQMAIQDKRIDMMATQWAISEQEEALGLQLKALNTKLFLADTYMHGRQGIVHRMKGERGTGPYSVFQERQFLNKEITLLANLTNFGFEQFGQLDKWLKTSGKMFKFLPYERTILVTQIRDKSKDYGCPWINMLENERNFVNIIWVRDGQNVWRIPTQLDFQNAVFPDVHEETRLTDYVAEYVYNDCFNPKERYESPFYKPEIPGQLKREPLTEAEPYTAIFKGPRTHATLDDWKASEDYTTKIQVEIAQAAGRYLTEHNMERMTFLLLLQGIVDNTNLLDIPKGTNLFDWKSSNAFFNLVRDYTHGLPDGRTRDLLAAAFRLDQVRIGDMLLVNEGPWDRAKLEKDVSYRRFDKWRFYTVVTRKDGKPLVVHYYPRKHHPHDPVRTPTLLPLTDNTPFIRLALPKSVVELALDSREWKGDNRELVTVLAQWDYVQEQAATATNFTGLRLKTPEGEDYGDE